MLKIPANEGFQNNSNVINPGDKVNFAAASAPEPIPQADIAQQMSKYTTARTDCTIS
ncbi:MAG: hypothetical protein ACRYE9_05530 [Janthinobacterium lividum]